MGDREQPAPEVGEVALESIDRAGDIDPHLRRDVIGCGRASGTQIPQQRRMVVTPQRGERVTVTGTGRAQQLGTTKHHSASSAPEAQNSSPNLAGTDRGRTGM